MIDFKGSHFNRDVILWGVRWYVAYPMSYRQLKEMMEERRAKPTVFVADQLKRNELEINRIMGKDDLAEADSSDWLGTPFAEAGGVK